MKTIRISTCRECPYILSMRCNTKFICNHPKMLMTKPYSIDRLVDPDKIADFCLLS